MRDDTGPPGTGRSDKLNEGDVWGYARKSNDDRGAVKSIEDQVMAALDTASEWGLPLAAEFVLAEKPGHGGDEWWAGGGGSGVEGDAAPQEKTRPVLTRLVQGVVSGKVKCIVVWSLCRLWRDVGICESMIKLFARYGCQLYDRNGQVDIATPEGRNAVRANAIAAQNMREMAAVNSPRGIRRSRGKGKAVSICNRLGFRSVPRTGSVRHVPEEQELVREIYRWYDEGMSANQIAFKLTAEGYQWLPDVKKPYKEKGTPLTAVHEQTILNLLRDCRYQGRIPHEKEEWPCPCLLVDGEPVVPTALWERVQRKLQERRRGPSGQSECHPLAGLVRCGLCGQSMRRQMVNQKLKSGRELRWHTWIAHHTETSCWCRHDLPTLHVDDVDAYVNDLLGPLLLAELQERAAGNREEATRDERAGLARQLDQAEGRARQLAAQWARGEMGMADYQDARAASAEFMSELRAQIRCLDRRLQDTEELRRSVGSLGSASEGARRDAIRAVLRWAAVIPSGKGQVRGLGHCPYKYLRSPDAGVVVFCTAWGTLHTAAIKRRKEKQEGMERAAWRCYLRPATMTEMIGTVSQFPAPADFVAGLDRSYRNKSYPYPAKEVTPGLTTENTSPIAEFDAGDDEFKSIDRPDDARLEHKEGCRD